MLTPKKTPAQDYVNQRPRESSWILRVAEAVAFALVTLWSFLLMLFLTMWGPNGAPGGSLTLLLIIFGVPGVWLSMTVFAHRAFREHGSRAPLLVLVLTPIVLSVAAAIAFKVWMHSYPDYSLCPVERAPNMPAHCQDIFQDLP